MMIAVWRPLVAILAALPAAAFATPEDPGVPALLAGTQAHARTAGEALWPGYGSAPFGLLLVEAEGERLFCQPAPSGFTLRDPDPITGCEVSWRVRSRLPNNLLAAMPVFGLPSTIVVGTPAATGRTPAAWSRTLLHEHFHQWQTALPGYYARVDALDLKDGDETGMWMLNFPVSYADAGAVASHANASMALVAALQARGRPDFPTALRHYLSTRSAFAATLGSRSWRYVEFQLWQEGVARWTEIELGRSHPDPEVRASAEALEREVLTTLSAPNLATQGRLFAYPHGAGEAMLLEICNPGWRAQYLTVLELGSLLTSCAVKAPSK